MKEFLKSMRENWWFYLPLFVIVFGKTLAFVVWKTPS